MKLSSDLFFSYGDDSDSKAIFTQVAAGNLPKILNKLKLNLAHNVEGAKEIESECSPQDTAMIFNQYMTTLQRRNIVK